MKFYQGAMPMKKVELTITIECDGKWSVPEIVERARKAVDSLAAIAAL